MRVAFRKHFDTQILNLCARSTIPFRPREKETDRETAENLQIDDDLLGESRVGSYHTNQQFLAALHSWQIYWRTWAVDSFVL